jgi:hypothetical protein
MIPRGFLAGGAVALTAPLRFSPSRSPGPLCVSIEWLSIERVLQLQPVAAIHGIREEFVQILQPRR